MKHGVPILHPLPPVRPLFVLVTGLLLTVLHGHPTFGAEVRKTKAVTAVKPVVKCDKAPSPVDRLICLEPSLGALDAAIDPAFREYLDRATRPADRDARAADQRLWLDSRATACPSAAQPQSTAAVDGAVSEDAVACLSRIYEQRLAVLRYERNAAAWPRIRFRPTIIEGSRHKALRRSRTRPHRKLSRSRVVRKPARRARDRLRTGARSRPRPDGATRRYRRLQCR